MEKKLLRCPPQNPLTSPAKFSNNSPVSHNVQTINHGHANCAYFESGKPKNRGRYNSNHGDSANRRRYNADTQRGGKGFQRRFSSNQSSYEVSRVEEVEDQQSRQNGERTTRHGTDASHLLNFTYSPLPKQTGGGRSGAVYRRGRGRRAPVHTKEQFLQAHCQFVVRQPQTDLKYLACLADADKMVEWEDIEQVILANEEQLATCPICLELPVAAKMTKCAHIYCWPCMLHCLSVSEKRWAKCPVCADSVEEKDLKSVIVQPVVKPKVGDKITFTLMKREREAMYVRPTTSWKSSSSGQLFGLNGDADDVRYSKLISATVEDIEAIVSQERRQLLQLFDREDTLSLEASFIQAALDQLSARSSQLKSSWESSLPVAAASSSDAAGTGDVVLPTIRSDPHLQTVSYADAFDDELSAPAEDTRFTDDLADLTSDTADEAAELAAFSTPGEEVTPIPEGGEEVKKSRVRTESSTSSTGSKEAEQLACNLLLPATGTQPGHASGSKRTEVYFFYQAADGQHVYLHSINTRVLAAQYKSLEMAPPTLTATIVECEENSMTSELRKRLKYLSHLPLYSQFMVCEVALRPPVVSSDCLANFKEEIDYRKKMRNRRLRTEAKHSSRVEAEERRRMGKYPDMAVPLTSDRHFPQNAATSCNQSFEIAADAAPTMESEFPLNAAADTPERQQGPPLSTPPLSTPPLSTPPLATPYSFSEAMTGRRGTAAAVWPRISTGSRYVRSSGPQAEQSHQMGRPAADGEEDELAAAPSFQQSFSADFDQLVKNAASAAASKPAGKGRQKKKRGVVLFSTSGQRSNM